MRLFPVVLGLLATSCAIAHADTIVHYTVTGSGTYSQPQPDGSYVYTPETASGSATFDATTQLFTDFTFSTAPLGTIQEAGFAPDPDFCEDSVSPYSCFGVALDPTAAIWGYQNFEQMTYFPDGSFARDGYEYYGTLTPVGTDLAPEPASFALLGTGLLGVVGVLRKRPA